MTKTTEQKNVSAVEFDYSQLDDRDAEYLKISAQRIKSEIASQTQSIIDTGNMLIQAKSKLRHGSFSRWVEAEICVSVRTAENYIRVAKLVLESKSEMISRLAPSTLYSIVAMPQSAKSEILIELKVKDADVKAVEAKVRAACSKKNGSALVGNSSDQLKAVKDIAELLRKLLDRDDYFFLCERIASLSIMGDPTSLRDALVAVFVEDRQASCNAIQVEPGSDGPAS